MELDQIERISKALADKTRLKIFEHIIRKEGVNCGELVALRGVTPATVSHHLKILLEAGLIECRRKGQFTLSTADTAMLADYAKSLVRLGRGKM